MTRGTVALAAIWVAGVVAIAIGDSVGAAALAGGILVAVALGALGAARLAALRRARIGSLRRQYAVGVAIAVGQMLLAAGLFAAVMFLDLHDALLLCLVSAFSGTVAILALRVSTRGVLTDVQALREHLTAVGDGRRDARLTLPGHDELAELAEAANQMGARLESAEETRRSLMAAVSHDLRTPLTSLRLIRDALGDGILAPDERQTYLDGMRLHLAALSGLIDDLFELSRLEAGEIAWSMQQVEIAMLVEDTVEAMRAEADVKGVDVRCEIPDGLPPACANPEKLQRVLFNLLQNAIRHTPPDGSVTVLAQAGADTLEIEVRDTGEGVQPADSRRVFDALFQGAGRTARSGTGAGLGLAISRAIVEAHGGRVWLAEATRGASVRFSLPLAGS